MQNAKDAEPMDARDSDGAASSPGKFTGRKIEFTRRKILGATLGVAAVASAGYVSAAGRNADLSEFLDGEGMPYDAFDRLPAIDIQAQGGVVHVGFAPGDFVLPKQRILARIGQAATAVTAYYGRFPVASVRFLVVPVDGQSVRSGTTWGYRGAAIRILLGRDTGEEALQRDWVMTHEMVHLALPDMSRRYNWLSEGLAVYIEPIARVQAGELGAKVIWADMKRDMPKGLPTPGDQGLDYDATWGRIYWGGALFCLLADIDIRRKTENRMGLQDAMRGVLAAGGNHEVEWSISRILATADKATGQTVMTDLYNDMRAKPVRPDMERLWRELGVEVAADDISLDDKAPLASIRAALTQRRSS
jgi:hypothetical protein